MLYKYDDIIFSSNLHVNTKSLFQVLLCSQFLCDRVVLLFEHTPITDQCLKKSIFNCQFDSFFLGLLRCLVQKDNFYLERVVLCLKGHHGLFLQPSFIKQFLLMLSHKASQILSCWVTQLLFPVFVHNYKVK